MPYCELLTDGGIGVWDEHDMPIQLSGLLTNNVSIRPQEREGTLSTTPKLGAGDIIGLVQVIFEEGYRSPAEFVLSQVLSAWVQALDFDFYAYLAFCGLAHSVALGQLHRFVSNYPEEWSTRYEREELQKCDPIVAVGRLKRETFAWRASDADICQSLEQRRVMEAAIAREIRCGITAPVHGPNGELSFLTFASKNADRPLAETITEFGLAMQWLNLYAHTQMQEATPSDATAPNLSLTIRERECLFWTSQGKTSWETSKIIGRSEATVNYHLKNCISKLEASNKCHAVTKAITHGLLYP
jgi:DNA-binding CsgD family transcriptional regulator